jgi:hypothetical protein
VPTCVCLTPDSKHTAIAAEWYTHYKVSKSWTPHIQPIELERISLILTDAGRVNKEPVLIGGSTPEEIIQVARETSRKKSASVNREALTLMRRRVTGCLLYTVTKLREENFEQSNTKKLSF